MGHPYAARNPQNIHEPPWLVHRQSGDLQKDMIKVEVYENPDGYIGNYGFRATERAIYIVGGTTKMVPRDVVRGTLGQHREALLDTMREVLKDRFGGLISLGV